MDYAGLGPPQLVDPDAMRTAKSVVRRALLTVSAITIAFFISGGIFTFTPLVGLRVAHTNGTSMEPTHRQGDVVLIKDVNADDLKVGDVVVFDALGQQIMHRIIEMRVESDGVLYVVTQGDNVATPDFPVRASQVNGKLVAEIPVLGSLSRLIHAKGGFYVYRSIVLTLAVSTVAIWGLAASARRREAPRAGDEPPTLVVLANPAEDETED